MNLWVRAALGGLAGTAAMSLLLAATPRWGLPPMSISGLLGAAWGGRGGLGSAAQFIFGTALGLVYAAFFAGRLRGHPVLRGSLFGLGSWVVEQAAIFPLVGVGWFSRSLPVSLGSLVGHLLYGAILGLACGAGADEVALADAEETPRRSVAL